MGEAKGEEHGRGENNQVDQLARADNALGPGRRGTSVSDFVLCTHLFAAGEGRRATDRNVPKTRL